MTHSDDNGLNLPSNIAPIQAVMVAVAAISDQIKIESMLKSVRKELMASGVRVEADLNYEDSYGRRLNYWEIRGVPLRIEIGLKEYSGNYLTVVRRDNFNKEKIERNSAKDEIKHLLSQIQSDSLERHRKFTEDNTHTVDSYLKFKEIMAGKRGFISAFWCEDRACEQKIKDETKASTRVRPIGAKKEEGSCVYCGKKALYRWYFAQAY